MWHWFRSDQFRLEIVVDIFSVLEWTKMAIMPKLGGYVEEFQVSIAVCRSNGSGYGWLLNHHGNHAGIGQ